MTDIVSIFPTAEDFRNTSIEQYSLYFFEQELNSIFRLIIWGKTNNLKRIYVDTLSEAAKDFLTEKGYKIIEENKDWRIEWGE